MRYGLLVYDENTKNFNIGDYIQSLAAKQFLPHVDNYISREKLADYRGDKIKVILNGWFTHNTVNWIPNDKIDPLFISFHLNNTAAPMMLSPQGVAYLKKHEPIGCRDHYTVSLLKDKGIEAYFSGCLTLTLDSYKANEEERNENVYIVDTLYGYQTIQKVFYNYKTLLRSLQNGSLFQIEKKRSHIKKIIDKKLLGNAFYISHLLPAKIYSHEQKFEIARKLLYKYARAKLVITSRIHCALPCLALGTPVIYINGFRSFVDSCRLGGLLDLFNRVDININTGDFITNFNLIGKITPDTRISNTKEYEIFASNLKMKSRSFMANDC